MTRRTRILGLAAALLGLACGAPDDVRPNVLLVSIDTLRADAVGAAGGPLPTPTLDRLAAQGVLFTRAIAPAPETAPTHATLFTGLDVLRHGVLRNGLDLPDALPTLAESFRDAGYTTAAFVSSFVLDPRFGWGRGFDHYDASFREERATLSREQAYEGAFWKDHAVEAFDRPGADTTRTALEWLAQAREPYFVLLHYFDPHWPYDPPPRFARRAAAADYDLARRAVPGIPRGRLARLVRRYHGEVLYTDHWLGRLLDGAGREDARERTLVIVTGDHGEGLGEHGWLEHGRHLYEEQVAVPLIFHWPAKVPARAPVRRAVGLIDVPRTIAELAGVPPPQPARPRSLTASVLDGSTPGHVALLGYRRELPERINRGGASFSVQRQGWKYIHHTSAPDELYNLGRDPNELRNLHGEHPFILSSLHRLLDGHRRRAAAAAARRPQRPLSDEERRGLEALGYLMD